ncbi:MAG: IucA/IucC family siderophore biosynthesis protein, partial [Candidatus Eremiobacteraeota bacterium]|nr:IucA/IucC family siderophore biosynthesis protein [Candidatus Eremiobacteraeota bacterium]
DPIRKRAAVEIMERLAMACQREGLLSCSMDAGRLKLEGREGGRLLLDLARLYTMNRFDLAHFPAELESVGPDGCFEWFLDHLLKPPQARRSVLWGELQNSYLNMALSLEALQSTGPGEPGVGDLADWEGRVWYGHPLHPGARLRSGLDARENKMYGPEWGARLELPLLCVPLDSLNEVGSFTDRILSLFPSLKRAGDGYGLVPVHPWQAENDLKTRFAERFETGELKFSDQTIPARPTMSFRTVVLQTEVGEDYHLKLPVAVQTTGATRTVSVAATQNGPLMSRFLSQLFAHPDITQTDLFDHLHLMAEPASFHLKDEEPDRSRFLSAVLRRGPLERKGDGARWLLPAQALLEPRENPLFLRAAEYYGLRPLALFSRYCRCLLPAQAFLCGELGIALEAHPQNIVVDFRGMRGSDPDVHFWYRDLGGIRLHPGRLGEALRNRGWRELEVPQFWPGSATSTDSVRDLSSKFVYSLLQNHMGELIRAICRHGHSEDDYWKVVYDVLDEHRPLMGPDLAERVFQPQWDLKAMWTMRLDSAITEYTFCPVENPILRGKKVCPA